jgi:hypothetical protein
MAMSDELRAYFDLATDARGCSSSSAGSALSWDWTKTMSRATFTSLLVLVLVLVSGCVLDPQVKDTEPASDGPTVYGRVHVSVDHVSER